MRYPADGNEKAFRRRRGNAFFAESLFGACRAGLGTTLRAV